MAGPRCYNESGSANQAMSKHNLSQVTHESFTTLFVLRVTVLTGRVTEGRQFLSMSTRRGIFWDRFPMSLITHMLSMFFFECESFTRD